MSGSDYASPYQAQSEPATRWLRGNLHAHTCCGKPMDFGVSGNMYAALGYDFLAITDHNQTPSVERWQQWQSQAPLVCVPGEENGRTGHIVELGVHEVTATPQEGSYAERARALRAGPGFVFGAHPQEYDDGANYIRSAADDLHAFEIFNGLRELCGRDESANVRLWDDLLSEGHRLWGVAVDDFHCAQITPGHGWVCVQVPDTQPITWQTIVERLKTGAFYASTGPRLQSIALDDDGLRVKADRCTSRLTVVGPGGATLNAVEDRVMSWQPPADLAYFRVEAESGVKRAWSQPFFAR